MDIQKLITERKQNFSRIAANIKDFQVFDFNYVPDRPVMRKELKPIIDAIICYEQSGIPNNLLIIGSRGSGKTVLVKYLKSLFSKELTIEYLNCRSENTSYKIMAKLLKVRARGFSLSELYQDFGKQYAGKTVLILDEVDLMSPKDKNRDVLYFLSRHPNNYMIILLSNNPRVLNEVDESTKSSLQAKTIYFKSYNALDIAKILQQRAKIGLKGFDIAHINQVSALVAQNTNSDVRVAIKTLFYCNTKPDRSIDANFESAKKDIFFDMIADLNDKNLLILKSACVSKENFVKQVYKQYLVLSAQKQESSYSYVHFYNTLSYLQSLGLIMVISAKINRNYTNKIEILFNENTLEKVFRARLG